MSHGIRITRWLSKHFTLFSSYGQVHLRHNTDRLEESFFSVWVTFGLSCSLIVMCLSLTLPFLWFFPLSFHPIKWSYLKRTPFNLFLLIFFVFFVPNAIFVKSWASIQRQKENVVCVLIFEPLVTLLSKLCHVFRLHFFIPSFCSFYSLICCPSYHSGLPPDAFSGLILNMLPHRWFDTNWIVSLK